MDFAKGDLSSTLYFSHEQLKASQNKLETQNNLILGCGRTGFCVEGQSWMVQNEMDTSFLLCKKRHFSKTQACVLLGL